MRDRISYAFTPPHNKMTTIWFGEQPFSVPLSDKELLGLTCDHYLIHSGSPERLQKILTHLKKEIPKWELSPGPYILDSEDQKMCKDLDLELHPDEFMSI